MEAKVGWRPCIGYEKDRGSYSSKDTPARSDSLRLAARPQYYDTLKHRLERASTLRWRLLLLRPGGGCG
jgi:hypothetical protein